MINWIGRLISRTTAKRLQRVSALSSRQQKYPILKHNTPCTTHLFIRISTIVSMYRLKDITCTFTIYYYRTTKLAPRLTARFIQSLESGVLPSGWMDAFISPVIKKAVFTMQGAHLKITSYWNPYNMDSEEDIRAKLRYVLLTIYDFSSSSYDRNYKLMSVFWTSVLFFASQMIIWQAAVIWNQQPSEYLNKGIPHRKDCQCLSQGNLEH